MLIIHLYSGDIPTYSIKRIFSNIAQASTATSLPSPTLKSSPTPAISDLDFVSSEYVTSKDSPIKGFSYGPNGKGWDGVGTKYSVICIKKGNEMSTYHLTRRLKSFHSFLSPSFPKLDKRVLNDVSKLKSFGSSETKEVFLHLQPPTTRSRSSSPILAQITGTKYDEVEDLSERTSSFLESSSFLEGSDGDDVQVIITRIDCDE
ncbi:hypothetical protein ADUPG1_008174 [Aduncisulcus paluster]|uniref:PX domain-containing protein n=1 Tax=Aduncisulcus paluster TaxID=2918883 RepID=A0ABQ5KR09_9EUKA|nr:hypothetical protein ADUPG1_008174 [Aduncisulcus paluster]